MNEPVGPERTRALHDAGLGGSTALVDHVDRWADAGRLRDVIIRGGHDISARQVEEALLQHPLVSDVSVIGLPDPRIGEIVCAVLVTRDGSELSLQDVRDHLVGTCQLAVWRAQERIEFVAAMPGTATGETQEHALRAVCTPAPE